MSFSSLSVINIYNFHLIGLIPEMNAGTLIYRKTNNEYKLIAKTPADNEILKILLNLKNNGQKIDEANIILELEAETFSLNLKPANMQAFNLSLKFDNYYKSFYENATILDSVATIIDLGATTLEKKKGWVKKEEEEEKIEVLEAEVMNKMDKILLLSPKSPLLVENFEDFWKLKLQELAAGGIKSINLSEVVVQKIFSILDEGVHRTINLKIVINTLFNTIINANISNNGDSESITKDVSLLLIKDIIQNELISRQNLITIIG